MLALINPVRLAEPFDHADWVFEAKFDGFRAAADTIRGQLISRNGNQMSRFEGVLDLLPKGHVFDGELVVLDDAGRPLFDELLFARRPATYVAFDLLIADGIDLRPLPLEQRKAELARIGEHAEGWIALTNGVRAERWRCRSLPPITRFIFPPFDRAVSPSRLPRPASATACRPPRRAG